MGLFASGVQSLNKGTVNQGAHTQPFNYSWYVSCDNPSNSKWYGKRGWGYSSSPSVGGVSMTGYGASTVWNGTSAFSVACDDNIYMRHKGESAFGDDPSVYKNSGPYQSWAVNPTLDDAPTLDNALVTSIRVGNGGVDSFTPATKDTAVDLNLQYKETSSGTWLDWDERNGNTTGYTDTAITSTTVTGLTPDTSYDFRYHLDRTGTVNSTKDYYSSKSTLSTLPDVPEMTTNAATNVNAGTQGVPDDGNATLNATVDRNGKTDLEWRFVYDETPTGGTYSNTTTWTASTSEPESVQEAIGSLTESEEYGYRVEVRWNSGAETDEGSEVTFDVPADPLATAEDEAHMFVYEYDAIQGEDKNVYFSYRDIATSSSDRFLNTAPATLHGAADGNGDVLIYIDGVLKATNSGKPDNNITQVGSTQLYSLVLDGSTELTGEDVMIQFIDTDGPAFRDFSVHIRTLMKTSQLDCDASGLTDQSGIVATGVGAGHGIEAVRGATGQDISGVLGGMVLRSETSGSAGTPTGSQFELDTGANATNNYYNGSIVMLTSSTGVGQSRVITAYDGTTKIATLDSAWAIGPLYGTTKYVLISGSRSWLAQPSNELSGIPSATASYGDKLQFLFQRFCFKIEQTATVQTWYKDNAIDTLGSRTVADDGNTQTLGEIS